MAVGLVVPYLRLPRIAREQWLLELPVTSRMVLDDRMLPTGRSEPVTIPPAPLGDRSFDDAFDGLAVPTEFAISGAGRRVSLRFVEGYRFAQVYAPRSSRFICFEPMTAPVNPFESEWTRFVEPGSAYIARFEIVVGPSGREYGPNGIASCGLREDGGAVRREGCRGAFEGGDECLSVGISRLGILLERSHHDRVHLRCDRGIHRARRGRLVTDVTE